MRRRPTWLGTRATSRTDSHPNPTPNPNPNPNPNPSPDPGPNPNVNPNPNPNPATSRTDSREVLTLPSAHSALRCGIYPNP
eukprot:scaffold20603_cov36-Phaeocystis_antarctica.AAC.2